MRESQFEIGVDSLTEPGVIDRSSRPHARGGVPRQGPTRNDEAPSSPRAWGCTECRPGHSTPAQVVPTRVLVYRVVFIDYLALDRRPHARGGVAVSITAPACGARSSPYVWGRTLRGTQRRLLADLVSDVGAGSEAATCTLTEGALVPPFAARTRKPIRSTGVEPGSSGEEYRFKRAEAIRE